MQVPENRIAKDVVDATYRVHSKLGPGLYEIVYEVTLTHELRKRGHTVVRQLPVPIQYDGIEFDEGFRADMVVDNLLVLELKSLEEIHRSHKKQLLTYLRLMNKRLGLLINFGEEFIKNGIYRIVNGLPDEDGEIEEEETGKEEEKRKWEQNDS